MCNMKIFLKHHTILSHIHDVCVPPYFILKVWPYIPGCAGKCFATLKELLKWVFVVSYFWGLKKHSSSGTYFDVRNNMVAPHQRCGDVVSFWYKLCGRFAAMNTPSANLEPHENSCGELAVCSEAPPWDIVPLPHIMSLIFILETIF